MTAAATYIYGPQAKRRRAYERNPKNTGPIQVAKRTSCASCRLILKSQYDQVPTCAACAYSGRDEIERGPRLPELRFWLEIYEMALDGLGSVRWGELSPHGLLRVPARLVRALRAIQGVARG